MAYIVQKDVVHYTCTCGLLKPISKLYFCRHCLQIRCAFCVCHEVDSHFCGKCAENIPSSEARLKKNRCSSCYDCPCCQHQLSIRMSPAGQKTSTTSSTDSKTSRKVYYLACLFCRWNTRDVGIPDQSVALGGWPERENIYANRLLAIQEKCKAVVLWEKQQKLDKEKKKHLQRGKYITLTDKTGLTAAMIRKRVGLPDLPPSAAKLTGMEVPPAIAQEEVEELNPEIFTKPLQLTEITTLEQRLLQPEWQPATVDLLFPIHKHLSVKRSLRCRTCEHNVSKPEYNPNSIKFKIQLFAYYHIPEIRLVTIPYMKVGEPAEVYLKIINPMQYQTRVKFFPLSIDDEKEVEKVEVVPTTSTNKDKYESRSAMSSLLQSPLTRQPSITVPPRTIESNINTIMELPDVNILLPPRDDAAEYDDSEKQYSFHDDPKMVTWRKSNKAILKFHVISDAELEKGDEFITGFIMQHIYVNTITTAENRDPQKCPHRVKVILNLGKVV